MGHCSGADICAIPGGVHKAESATSPPIVRLSCACSRGGKSSCEVFLQALTAMQAAGLLKGGSEGCSIVGYGDRWYNSDSVRFFDDEPVRHKLLDFLVRSGLRSSPRHDQTLNRQMADRISRREIFPCWLLGATGAFREATL